MVNGPLARLRWGRTGSGGVAVAAWTAPVVVLLSLANSLAFAQDGRRGGRLPAAAQASVPALDSLQQAVIDSLERPARTTAPDLLDAAVRAFEVDAPDAAISFLARVGNAVDQAGDGAADLLADLGDSFDTGVLRRMERTLSPREPRAGKLLAGILDAARLRRRDPARLAKAAADLRSDDVAVRLAAAGQLARVGAEPLPLLVETLQSREPGADRARPLVHQLLRDMGAAVRQPLLAWLGTDDVVHWPGIIEALAVADVTDVEDFLLAPALAPDTPPAAQAAALAALGPGAPPTRAAAIARLAARLDRTLSAEGLPAVDRLALEPITDPRTAAAAFGGHVAGTVERPVWNPRTRGFDRLNLPPRAARVLDAMHVARDLMALGPEDPALLRLPLLARLEALLVSNGEPATALQRLDPSQLRVALAGPEGFDVEMATEMLDLAIARGMREAAAAIATALEPVDTTTEATLPPATRAALMRALAVPDDALQFAAARTLVLATGAAPAPGSSRVVEVLAHAATATGVDRVVVAHPEAAVAQALAADVSRFGYESVRVSTGRAAILAARGHADTVLVLLGARIVKPTAWETVQLLQQPPVGAGPAILVVVDPLDEDGRNDFLRRQILRADGLDQVAVVDRLDSFFAAVFDEQTGDVISAPRFPDALARAAGPQEIDPATRTARRQARLDRARQAFALLGKLGARGWDVSAAEDAARLAVSRQELRDPAVGLLAVIGRPEAQAAVARVASRSDLPAASMRLADAALAASISRYGRLLPGRGLSVTAGRYNRSADTVSSRPPADPESAPLEAEGAADTDASSDAPRPRPTP